MSIDLPSRDVIKAIHKRQSQKFGGSSPDCDESKINAALAWPRLMVTTGSGADIFAVAVSLMMGIITEKPYLQGNSRLGFSLGVLTLRRNGWMLDISNSEAISLMTGLSDRHLSEEKVVDYFRKKSEAMRIPA